MTAIARRANDQLEHDLLVTWLEEARVGLCVLDAAGKVVMLNSAAGRKLHVDPLHMLHVPVATLFEHVDCSINTLQWLASPGFNGEKQIHGKAGTPQRLLLKANTVVRGASHYKVISITDVTDLWQAQEAANLLARQWDALGAALTIADATQPDCPITYVNPRFEQMTGYAAAEILGKNCRFLQSDDTRQPGIATMAKALQAEEPVQVLLRNYRKDGSLFWVEVNISPVHDASGKLTHFVAIQHPRNPPATAAH